MHLGRIKRGTGRTHNMIVAAFAHAAQTGSAVVIMDSGKEVAEGFNQFLKTDDFNYWHGMGEVKLQTHGERRKVTVHLPHTGEVFTVDFISGRSVQIDWNQFRLPGVSQASTFIDHHAIETHYQEVLSRWTRYDNKLSNLNCGKAQRHFEHEQQ